MAAAGRLARRQAEPGVLAEEPYTALLRLVASGDRTAFRQLHEAAAPKLAGILARILRNPAELDDAVQDVFIRIWNRAAQFDAGRGNGLGWMVAIARNHALDRLRARPEARGRYKAEPEADGTDPLDRLADPAPGAEARLVAQGELARMQDCFAELEPDRAQMVQGAYLQGLSYQELAERHAAPLNTIRTWLRRSLIRLRECLDR